MRILGVDARDDHLLVDISGKACRFHFLWLRDNSPDCRTRNLQRLHETSALEPGIRPVSVSHDATELRIAWPDAAQSRYPVEFLSARVYDAPAEPDDRRRLWAGDIAGTIGYHDYAVVREQPSALRAWLQDVERYGFGLLENVPAVEGTLLDVVGLFGFLRETNYGRLFDVRTERDASNLAYTPLPLSLHTDNPYRDPCPTLQLLHCLVQAEEGGVTAIADGFRAVEVLGREHPDALGLLAGHEVSFHYASDDVILECTDRIVTLDAKGKPRKIRLNNRSLAPLMLDFGLVLPFYRALTSFHGILESEESQFRLRLRPGDLLLLDNERVLHGRIGRSVGPRHLQGCYADRDGLISSLRLLEKRGD